MRFMVEIDAGMEKANAIDAGGGPGIPAPSQLITATALTSAALDSARRWLWDQHFNAGPRPRD